jgi:DNA repair exonuclease SbcCD nuclease subunit
MKILFTSDWQASFQNLDQCEKVVADILALCERKHIKHVVHCGDVKDPFNPVDVRVVNWIVDVGRRFCDAGIALYVNLGNHDKVGMADTTDDWFPVLEASGINTFRDPNSVTLSDGTRLFFVPYSRDNDKLRKWLRKFSKQASPHNSILVFHCEINGCQHNQLTKSKNKDAVGVKDLFRKQYMFCLGGHIHLFQQLSKNVYYVGSPFAYDWGEANQIKGHVIIDTDKKSLKFSRSHMPGMYDPLWPGFKENRPTTWEGSSVRVHVACDKSVVNLAQFLEQAEKRASKQYPGAHIIVEPEFLDERVQDFLVEGTGDRELIAAYVGKHCIANLSDQKRAIVSYLAYKLEHAGYLRRAHGRLTFLRSRCTNFLSYKKLDIRYNRPGILLVTGRNEDWPGKSNGCGKTSYLQPPAVALFGKTLKGQEHDRWARRDCKERARDMLLFKLANGKLCKVVRTRHPVGLQVFVSGKDLSTGRGTRDTQKLIEQLTGLTWDVLVNSIYISQSEVTKILTGTDAERKNIFAQFLGLERFKLARDLIAKDIKRTNELVGEIEQACKFYDEQVQQVQRFMLDLPKAVNLEAIKAKREKLKAEHLTYATRVVTIRKLLRQAERAKDTLVKEVRLKRDAATERGMRARSIILNARKQIEKLEHIGTECPVCQQSVPKAWVRSHLKRLGKESSEAKAAGLKADAKYAVYNKQIEDFASAVRDGNHKVQVAEFKMESISDQLERLRRDIKEATRREQLERKYKRQREAIRRKVRITSRAAVQLHDELSFYKFCLQTFSRDGLPAFLAYQLCPRLNKAAEHYSKLFSEGQIHVRFVQEDEDINVQILNPHGGESMEDQSQGESASLVSLLALP